MEKELKVIRVKSNELVKDIAFQIMYDVTEGTVVDTSKAVSNWVATLDSPSNIEIEANSQGKGGSTASDSIDVAILKSSIAIKERKEGQSIFISNNIEGDKYQERARVSEAEQEAYDNALIAVEKAKVLVGGAL